MNTRGSLLPDPTQDPIEAIFYCLQNEDEAIPDNGRKEGQYCGIIAVRTSTVVFLKLGLTRYTIDLVEDEMDLVKCLVEKVQSWDPEIFTGYDVLKDSWGYFVERVDEIGKLRFKITRPFTDGLLSARIGHCDGVEPCEVSIYWTSREQG